MTRQWHWVSVVVGVALVVLAALTSGCKFDNRYRDLRAIEADAYDFAKLMDGKAPRGVQCVNADSDNDGYVTCTVFLVDRDPYSIQCASAAGWTGCKPTVPKVIVKGTGQ